MPNLAIVKPQPGDEITSAWGTSVADGMNGIQSGQLSVALSAVANIDATITYPKAYVSAPIVIVQAVGGQMNMAQPVSVPTALIQQIRCFKRDGTAFPASGTLLVQWIAMGILA